ncbi:MAG: phosphoadenosine phosphosulfate reductase family protein [Hyphomicrobiaceae bacterium]
MSTPDLLHYLIKERFAGEVVVTASLVASSIVILKMVSDIDPETPVIFCHRPPIFEESVEYRTEIIKRLGLKNVSMNDGNESIVQPGDSDHCERMWIQYLDMPGRSLQLLHLNQCLSPYKCWISAVYHVSRPANLRNRVDVDGRLVKIDPLIRWTKDDVGEFMRANELPYHKMAKRSFSYKGSKDGLMHPTYNF